MIRIAASRSIFRRIVIGIFFILFRDDELWLNVCGFCVFFVIKFIEFIGVFIVYEEEFIVIDVGVVAVRRWRRIVVIVVIL